jgi:hypothetical protein
MVYEYNLILLEIHIRPFLNKESGGTYTEWPKKRLVKRRGDGREGRRGERKEKGKEKMLCAFSGRRKRAQRREI